jgi:hypothetical protein
MRMCLSLVAVQVVPLAIVEEFMAAVVVRVER